MVSIPVVAGNLEEIKSCFKTSIDCFSFMWLLKSTFLKILCPKF